MLQVPASKAGGVNLCLLPTEINPFLVEEKNHFCVSLTLSTLKDKICHL